MTVEKIDKPFIDKRFGIYNKEFFFESGMNILKLSKRNKRPISLAIIDIDNLSELNELYGYEIMNEKIKEIGSIIRNKTRDSDLLAYLEDGRFAILLYNISGINTNIILDTIRKEITHKINLSEDSKSKLTVSIGASIIQFQTDESTFKNIYDNAYMATNNAKEKGKNCVIAY